MILRKADAIEIVVGQGAKPGGGGMLLGQKISDRVAEMRNLPKGIDQRSACRHPDWTGPDDLEIKILSCAKSPVGKCRSMSKSLARAPITTPLWPSKPEQMQLSWTACRAAQRLRKMCSSNMSASRPWPSMRPAVRALQDLGMHRKVQLILSGGIRTGADVAKAMALGADAVAIGTAALIALGDNDPKWEAEYNELGTTAGAYDDWHEGQDPAGITTQDPELMARFDPDRRGAAPAQLSQGDDAWKRKPLHGLAARTTCTIWNQRTWWH